MLYPTVNDQIATDRIVILLMIASPHRVGFWLCSLLIFVYLLGYSGLRHSIDEKSALAAAESFLLDGSWHTNQIEWEQLWKPSQNILGVDGNLYSKKGFGMSLVALPLLALGRAWDGAGAVRVANLTGLLLALATLYTFFHLVLALDYPLRTAGVATTALAVGTPLWVYSKTLFGEPLATLGICMALYGGVRFRQSDSRIAASVAGLGLALVVLAKVVNGLICLAFALYLLHIARRRYTLKVLSTRFLTGVLLLGAFLGLSVLATVIYNDMRFHRLLQPLDPMERFSTPMWLGLLGLLISPGKGVLWYVPLVWLIGWNRGEWRQRGRGAEFWLAGGTVLLIVLLYSTWFDWDGGRAWGPRMIIFTMPALVMLTLPALDRFAQDDAPRLLRFGIGAVLLLSVLAQLPGVLVNFDLEEERVLLAGVASNSILWEPAHSPLITYWAAIGSATSDPVWLHSFFWRNPPLLLALLAGGAILFLWTAAHNLRRIRRGRTLPATLLGIQAALLPLLAAGFVLSAQEDERWFESTSRPQDNRDLVEFIQASAGADDIVLLDLIPHFDIDGRTWFWMNAAAIPPAYIGWLRKAEMGEAEQERLARWLQTAPRIWLVLEGTPENAPESTTEVWLNHWAYAGRRQWIGEQRVVEYIRPPGEKDSGTASVSLVAAADGFYRFGHHGDEDGVVLESFALRQINGQELYAVDLVWAEKMAEPLHLSLQALTAEGTLAAQLDRPIGEDTQNGQPANRLGLAIAQPFARIILKVYRPESGEILPFRDASQESDSLLLFVP